MFKKPDFKLILYLLLAVISGIIIGFVLTGFTNTDQGIFWSAVEGLGTVGTLFIALIGVKLIYEQLKNLQEQSIQHDIAGLEFAFKNLTANNDYVNSYERILAEADKDLVELNQELMDAISFVLSRIDFVKRVVDIGYGTKELLFAAYLPEFLSVSLAISVFEEREKIDLSVLKDVLYTNAFELLNEANKRGSKKLTGIDLQIK